MELFPIEVCESISLETVRAYVLDEKKVPSLEDFPAELGHINSCFRCCGKLAGFFQQYHLGRFSPNRELIDQSIVKGGEMEQKAISYKLYDLDDIEKCLPHRGIALCINEILIPKASNGKVIGFWTPDEKYFDGHFGVLPGHWAGESACLVGGFYGKYAFEDLQDSVPMLAGAHIVPEHPLILGQTLRHELELIARENRLLSFSFQSIRLDNEKRCFKGEFSGNAIPPKIFNRMLERMK